MFKANVNSIDRVLRIIIGLVLLSLVFIGPQTLWGLAGTILIITGFVRFCPIYHLFSIRTCASHKDS